MIAPVRMDAPRADRTPPQNLDAETGLLGSVMIDNAVFDDVALIVEEQHFYRESHRIIWSALKSLQSNGTAFDAVTIAELLLSRKQLEDVGGAEYLEEILNSVPHSAHARFYADIVREKATRRALIVAATDMLRSAYDETGEVDEVIADGEAALRKLLEGQARNTAVPMREVVVGLIEQISTPRPRGISTGFWDLDRILAGGGFCAGQSIILGARSSMGKSALAANIAANIAREGVAVLWVSLEMSNTESALRLVRRESRMTDTEILGGKLEEYQMHAVMQGAETVANLPIFCDDRPGRTVSQISALARLHKARNKIGFVVVDYLQLVTSENKRIGREQQVAEISRDLKLLAQSLGVPILTLAQLNRGIEAREDKTPRLSDLRESGSIEQDADTVLFLDRPHSWDSSEPADVAIVYVGKQRNGPTGKVPLIWDGRWQRFDNDNRMYGV